MIGRFRRLLIGSGCVAAVLAAPSTGDARQVGGAGEVLKPRFVTGDHHDFRVVTSSSLHGEDAGRVSTYVQDCDVRFTVLGIDDSGGATLTATLRRARIEITLPDGSKAATELTSAPTEAESGGVTGRLAGALLDCVVRFDASAEGVVTSVTGFEPAERAAAAFPAEGARALGLYSEASAPRLLSSLLAVGGVDAGEHAAVKPGESWASTTVSPMAKSGDLVTTTRYTLESIENGVAVVGGKIVVSVVPPTGEQDPTIPTLDVSDQSGSARIRWDVSKGVLVERTVETTLTMRASLGGVIKTASTVKTELRATRIDAAKP